MISASSRNRARLVLGVVGVPGLDLLEGDLALELAIAGDPDLADAPLGVRTDELEPLVAREAGKLGPSSKSPPPPRVTGQRGGQARGLVEARTLPGCGALQLRQHVLSQPLGIPGVQARPEVAVVLAEMGGDQALQGPRPVFVEVAPVPEQSASGRSGRSAHAGSAARKSSFGTAPVSMARTARSRSWLISATWSSLSRRVERPLDGAFHSSLQGT